MEKIIQLIHHIPTIHIILGIGMVALAIALINVVRLWGLGLRTRDACEMNAEGIARVASDWGSFSEEQKQQQEDLAKRMDAFQSEMQAGWADLSSRAEEFEQSVSARVQELQTLADTTHGRIGKLEDYIRDFFDEKLKSVFRSFDETVGSVLGEMKSEMLRGVKRIDEMQAMVGSKSMAEQRVLEGEEGAYKFLTETTGETLESEDEAAPGATEEVAEEEEAPEEPAESEDEIGEEFGVDEPSAEDAADTDSGHVDEEETGEHVLVPPTDGGMQFSESEEPDDEPEDEDEQPADDPDDEEGLIDRAEFERDDAPTEPVFGAAADAADEADDDEGESEDDEEKPEQKEPDLPS